MGIDRSADANQLSTFERDVLRVLLSGDDAGLEILRLQCDSAHVVSREYTGHGFFTGITTAADVPRLPYRGSVRFGDIGAALAGLEHGAGFLLFIDDGLITMLEGYSYDEPWPDSPEQFDLFYLEGERDLEAVRKELSGMG